MKQNYEVRSYFKCEVELEDDLLKELKQRAEQKTTVPSSQAPDDGKKKPENTNEKLYFVSALLMSNSAQPSC